MHTLLELLEQDCTQPTAQLAAQAGMTEAEVEKEPKQISSFLSLELPKLFIFTFII